jgi:hypothetical protein
MDEWTRYQASDLRPSRCVHNLPTEVHAAADPQLAGRTGVWITESSKVGEPSRTARDDDLAARVYERIAGMVGGADVRRVLRHAAERGCGAAWPAFAQWAAPGTKLRSPGGAPQSRGPRHRRPAAAEQFAFRSRWHICTPLTPSAGAVRPIEPELGGVARSGNDAWDRGERKWMSKPGAVCRPEERP